LKDEKLREQAEEEPSSMKEEEKAVDAKKEEAQTQSLLNTSENSVVANGATKTGGEEGAGALGGEDYEDEVEKLSSFDEFNIPPNIINVSLYRLYQRVLETCGSVANLIVSKDAAIHDVNELHLKVARAELDEGNPEAARMIITNAIEENKRAGKSMAVGMWGILRPSYCCSVFILCFFDSFYSASE
jgi:hypothetical protein